MPIVGCQQNLSSGSVIDDRYLPETCRLTLSAGVSGLAVAGESVQWPTVIGDLQTAIASCKAAEVEIEAVR